MNTVAVTMYEPGPRARTLKLEELHGVLFDDADERAYVLPDRFIQTWSLKGNRLRRSGRTLLLTREQDVPPQIGAGPEKDWRSSAGPDRWEARNLLLQTESMRGSKDAAGTGRTEAAALIGLVAAVAWLLLGMGTFMWKTFLAG